MSMDLTEDEKKTFELAKKFDQLAASEEQDWDIVSSALLFMLKTMLEKRGVDISPLDKACEEMGLVSPEYYN